MSRRVSPEGLTLGVALIGVGILWTLSNLGKINLIDTLHTYWPILLIFWGLIELVDTLWSRREKAADGGALPPQTYGQTAGPID
ncbi:MAG: DUF5668 domain-containing protein [Vicinamibacteria bacterium]|jgi:hypothetical protein|nr:DUF5668 domain-containing protein [Vicinamibacteria bacterium]